MPSMENTAREPTSLDDLLRNNSGPETSNYNNGGDGMMNGGAPISVPQMNVGFSQNQLPHSNTQMISSNVRPGYYVSNNVYQTSNNVQSRYPVNGTYVMQNPAGSVRFPQMIPQQPMVNHVANVNPRLAPSGPPTNAVIRLHNSSLQQPFGSCGPPSNSSLTIDKDKKAMIQRQLLLLLHSNNCTLAEQGLTCDTAHCSIMKQVLSHMSQCKDGKNCSTPHCASSKQIISHWKSCNNQDCKVCQQVRGQNSNINDNSGGGSNMAVSMQLENTVSENSASADTALQTISPFEYQSKVADWRSEVSDGQRSILVRRLVKTIFPAPNPQAFNDPRMKHLIEFSRKIEFDNFCSAGSREDYFHRLADKCFKIHRELEEKKKRRIEGQMEQNQVSAKEEVKQEVEERKYVPSTNNTASSQQSDNKSVVSTPVTKTEPISPELSTNKSFLPGSSSSSGTIVHGVPKYKKYWQREELLAHFMIVHRQIVEAEDAWPFLLPVDPLKLGIPDYPIIITHPMDLQTIRQKLERGDYKDPWSIVDDYWLMFNNAWLYNKKNSKVYRACTKLAELFDCSVDRCMRDLGLCCGHDFVFLPQVQFCNTKNVCAINRDAVYYFYEKKQVAEGFTQKFCVCEKCYDQNAEMIPIVDDSNPDQETIFIEKTKFCQKKNNVKEKEKFVYCVECGRKWHQVCALHLDELWPTGFVCPKCLDDRPPTGPTAAIRRREIQKFPAKKLPNTRLGAFLEKRVNDFLKKKESGTGEVTIRVLYSGDKSVEVKPLMRQKYCENGAFADSFPYRSKAIFAFQEIDKVDVCFFGLHVQEYGSECAPPNQRRVYIAYLDSVFFFRPKLYRTDVYHEILIGYLHYAKYLGYTTAHIWACPPSEGDDYIFHMHPPDQKIPKPKRLQEWYLKMLEKALMDGIVQDYKDILSYAVENKLDYTTEIPYFEGDFWSSSMEEILKEVDEEETKRRHEEEDHARQEVEENEEEEEDGQMSSVSALDRRVPTTISGSKKNKLKKRKNNKKGGSSSAKRKKNSKTNSTATDSTDKVIAKVYEMMEKHKDVFFVIRLHQRQDASQLESIVDPDPLISSEMMESRDNFLAIAREKHLEFSSLRRAKFSTISILYELHNETRPGELYSCNNCNRSLNSPYHCKTCSEYDLCEGCYSKENHPHQMVRITSLSQNMDDGPSTSEHQVGRQENMNGRNKVSIERCIESLSHACYCRDTNCRQNNCKKMKNILKHLKSCDKKGSSHCLLCRQLIALCCYHAKHCKNKDCKMPFCTNIKYRWQQQHFQQRVMQQQIIRRRIANMQRSGPVATLSGQAAATVPVSRQNVSMTTPTTGPAVPIAQKPNAAATHYAVAQLPSAALSPNRMLSLPPPGGPLAARMVTAPTHPVNHQPKSPRSLMASAEKRKIVHAMLNKIKAEGGSGQYQNRALQEWLRKHPELVETFCTIRDEHKKGLNGNSLSVSSGVVNQQPGEVHPNLTTTAPIHPQTQQIQMLDNTLPLSQDQWISPHFSAQNPDQYVQARGFVPSISMANSNQMPQQHMQNPPRW